MRFLIICPPWEPGAVRVLPGDGDLRDGAGCGLGFGSPRDPVGVLCNLICEHRTYERWTEESLRFAGTRLRHENMPGWRAGVDKSSGFVGKKRKLTI